MAGTCNDCGASTWGRYKICPDCRKARKRKGGYSSNRGSGLGERYVCNSCNYGWRSKKDFGGPAVCPKCKDNDIIPYRETEQFKRERKSRIISGIFVIVFATFLIFWFNYNSTQNEEVNLPIEDSSIQPINEILIEDNLIDFCRAEFLKNGISNINKMEELEDFSIASNWIRNNYINSALTQEQKQQNVNYIIENQLPKQSYPIVITYGSKKDGQLISQGFYYCNKNGVI